MNRKPDISATILELCKVPRTCTELERKTLRSRTNVMVAVRKLLAEGRLREIGLRRGTTDGIKPKQYLRVTHSDVEDALEEQKKEAAFRE